MNIFGKVFRKLFYFNAIGLFYLIFFLRCVILIVPNKLYALIRSTGFLIA